MKLGTRLKMAVATLVLVASVGACGGGPDDAVSPPSQKAPFAELPSNTATTTDNSAAEAAAKAQADAAAAAKTKAAAEAKAKAAAEAKTKAAAEAKTKAAAEAKAKAAAEAKAKAAAAATAKAVAAAKAKAAAAAEEEESENDVYYENCTAVREAGADPIRRGDPGYSTDLDRDQDGIACE